MPFSSRCLVLPASVLALALGACAQPPSGAPRAPAPVAAGPVIEADFLCGNQRVHAVFEQNPSRATLRVNASTYALQQAISASGARYVGQSAQGPVEFWNRGNQAQFSVGSQSYPTCIEQPRAAAAR